MNATTVASSPQPVQTLKPWLISPEPNTVYLHAASLYVFGVSDLRSDFGTHILEEDLIDQNMILLFRLYACHL